VSITELLLHVLFAVIWYIAINCLYELVDNVKKARARCREIAMYSWLKGTK
jgi:hypothetical protein